MSRRSRKRRGAVRPAWQGRLAIAILLFAIIATGGLYIAVRGYLHSEGFRRFLSAKVGEAAKVDGSFAPFRWHGLAVRSEEYHATGGQLIRQLRINDLRTEVGLGGLGRGVWQIKNSSARRVEIEIDARKTGRASEPSAEAVERKQESKARSSVPGWLPTKLEPGGLTVDGASVRAVLDGGTAAARGIRIDCQPVRGTDAHDITLHGGTITLPHAMAPELQLENARFRHQDGRVFLHHASAGAWGGASLELSGEADVETLGYSLEGGLSGVDCAQAFDETWARRVSGTLESSLEIANASGEPVARGHAVLHRGVLTALPVLDSLAAYTDTRRFRTISLDEASTDWKWTDGELRFTNIRLGSEALIHVEGSLAIRGRNLDGTFLLGIAPGVLASIPGAETDVFLPGERGLLWAPLRLTGTLDEPEEDLTDRLVAAAGLRMFEILPRTGEKVLRHSRAILEKNVPGAVDEVMEQGGKILREGGGILREAGDMLDDILGPAPSR